MKEEEKKLVPAMARSYNILSLYGNVLFMSIFADKKKTVPTYLSVAPFPVKVGHQIEIEFRRGQRFLRYIHAHITRAISATM